MHCRHPEIPKETWAAPLLSRGTRTEPPEEQRAGESTPRSVGAVAELRPAGDMGPSAVTEDTCPEVSQQRFCHCKT